MTNEEKFEEWFKVIEDVNSYPEYACISKIVLRKIWDAGWDAAFDELMRGSVDGAKKGIGVFNQEVFYYNTSAQISKE